MSKLSGLNPNIFKDITAVFRQPPAPPPYDRFNWHGLYGKPYITVSAKGLANGLSDQFNDGADFGPDTPGTKTSGIQEAHNYRVSLAKQYPSDIYPYSFYPIVQLITGTFICDADIVVYPNNNGVLGQTATMPFVGMGRNSISQVIFQGNATYGFDFSGAVAGTNIHLSHLNLRANKNGLTSLINAQLGASSGGNYIELIDIQFANIGSAIATNALMLSGISFIYMDRCADELNSSTTNAINITGGATGSNYFNMIAYRGAGAIINIDASIQDTHIDLKSGTQIKVTSNGQITNLLITGTNDYELTNAGTIDSFKYNAIMQAPSPYITNSGTIDRLSFDGFLAPSASSGNLISNTGTINWIVYEKSLKYIPNGTYKLSYQRPTPTISVNPPVSGTAYQNTLPYDILIYLPVYTSTSGTAGNVKASIGASSSSLTQVINEIINSGTSSSNTRTIILKVPAGWWYEFVGTTATFATAEVVTD